MTSFARPSDVPSVAHLVVDDPSQLTLAKHDFHHVARVLRARPGELVTLTDGAGAWSVTEVPPQWDDASIPLVMHTPVQVAAPRRPLTIAVSLVKQDKPETVVQKLTEAGVDRIVFLAAAHSIVRWDADRAQRHLERLRAVAIEAVGQSRQVWVPQIDGPLSPTTFWSAELTAERAVCAAHMAGRSFAAMEIDTMLIGPEGGWSADELSLFDSATVRIGDAVFRAETAAVAAAVLMTARRSGLVSG
jgi:16S rRNA (uracil1498-N3)-methyltransferase